MNIEGLKWKQERERECVCDMCIYGRSMAFTWNSHNKQRREIEKKNFHKRPTKMVHEGIHRYADRVHHWIKMKNVKKGYVDHILRSFLFYFYSDYRFVVLVVVRFHQCDTRSMCVTCAIIVTRSYSMGEWEKKSLFCICILIQWKTEY